uniref:receptor protein-tyrosine kinase n=1 Tax=Takifugu rubripes TaxID=31033 RepID=A0A674MPJ0_TAKRU
MKSYCLLLSITLSCCCSSEDLPDPPSIHLNSKYLPNQAEAILTAGTPFTLRCTGASSVHWSSSAFCLLYHGRLVDPIDVQRADPRHTGTYCCGYTNQSLEHLSTWIHLYVKDPADPSTVFVTPRNSPRVKEGQDFLYRCLLTDPSVTNLTFQPEDNIQGSGQHLPVGMNVTVDPQRGALIQDVQRSFSGQYVCSGWKDGRHFISRSFHLLVAPRLPPPSVAIHQNKAVRLEGEKFEVTCVSSSTTHLFNVTWTHLTKKNFDVAVTREYRNSHMYISSTLMIAAVSQEDRGTYTCAAASEDGVTTATTHLIVLGECVSADTFFKPKYEIRWKIIESTEGNHYTFVDPTLLPYNYKWEFPRDKLRLGAVLGSGAFGKVVEATAYGLGTDDVTRVAVKMLKRQALSEEREALMSELKILSHLGYHDNIVNLLGACTQGGPMLMITEYCSYGDLLNFLRARAQDFMASILSADEMEGDPFYKNMATLYGRLRSDSGISCCSDYQEMQPILGSAEKQQGVQMGGLSFGDLLSFSHQVAQGLDFLSTRNCIHRDVAARNVLLTDHRVAKICDFGLARDIQNDDSYIVQGNVRVLHSFSLVATCLKMTINDVICFILKGPFTMGNLFSGPYPNVAVDTHFYKMIKDGRHMTQPDFAPVEMYQLMTHCWSLEPTDRPTFKMICQLIDRLLQSNDDTNHQSYSNINETKKDDFKGGKSQRRGEEEEQRRQRGNLWIPLSVTVCLAVGV